MQLMKPILICGYDVFQFWDLTIGEMNTIMEVYQTKEEARAKEQLTVNYNLASNIVGFLGLSLAGKPIPKFDKLYPDIDKNNGEATALKLKEQLKQFAEGFNKKRANK